MEKSALRYRQATPADIPSLSVIRLAVVENKLTDPSKVTLEGTVSYLTEIGRGWVAEDNGEIVGFAIANRSGLIWALFVAPGQEGRGIGSSLLGICLDWLRHLGVERAMLDTARGTRADGFYRRRGWSVLNETPDRVEFGFDLTSDRHPR